MGTVKAGISKGEKRESLKRGKSFNSHFPTKYSTMDGRQSRGGSRPTLSNVSVGSSSLSLTNPSTPVSKTPVPKSPLTAPQTPLVITPTKVSHLQQDNDIPSPPRSINGDVIPVTNGGSPDEGSPPVGLYVVPVDSPTSSKSEYANVIVLPKDEEELASRSLSFSGGIQKPARNRSDLSRTESDAMELRKNINNNIQPPPVMEGDFASKLAAIQTQLHEKMGKKTDEDEENKYVGFSLHSNIYRETVIFALSLLQTGFFQMINFNYCLYIHSVGDVLFLNLGVI